MNHLSIGEKGKMENSATSIRTIPADLIPCQYQCEDESNSSFRFLIYKTIQINFLDLALHVHAIRCIGVGCQRIRFRM